LDEFADIVVDELPNELPPVRSIIHHIDLIPRDNLTNKATYQMTPHENEVIINQVKELLDKGLVREILSQCVVPIVLSPKTMEDGECAQNPELSTKLQSGIDFHYPELKI